MKIRSSLATVIFALSIASVASAPFCKAQAQDDAAVPTPAEISLHMRDLEKQVSDLRSELAAMKQSDSPTPISPTQPGSAVPPEYLEPIS